MCFLFWGKVPDTSQSPSLPIIPSNSPHQNRRMRTSREPSKRVMASRSDVSNKGINTSSKEVNGSANIGQDSSFSDRVMTTDRVGNSLRRRVFGVVGFVVPVSGKDSLTAFKSADAKLLNKVIA